MKKIDNAVQKIDKFVNRHLGKKLRFQTNLSLPYTPFLGVVVASNCAFTLFVALLESTACNHSNLPNEMWNPAVLTPGDMLTAEFRKESDLPLNFAIFECILGFCVVAMPSFSAALGDFVPGALVIILVMLRIHSLGVFGCYETDHICCPNLDCPAQEITDNIKGCGKGDFVYWRNSENYCPIPPWYLPYKNQCGQLAAAQNVVPCKTYGCEFATTPVRYIANRVWTIFSFLTLLGATKNLIVIDMIKLGTIKILTKNTKK